MRASHLLLRLPLSGGDPLRWFVGVDIHFTSCSGGRGVSTVGLSSSGSVHCAKSIELFQIWSSPGPSGRLMSQWQSPSVPTVVVNEILNRGADNVVIHITHVSAHVYRTSSPKLLQFLISSLYTLRTFGLRRLSDLFGQPPRPQNR